MTIVCSSVVEQLVVITSYPGFDYQQLLFSYYLRYLRMITCGLVITLITHALYICMHLVNVSR